MQLCCLHNLGVEKGNGPKNKAERARDLEVPVLGCEVETKIRQKEIPTVHEIDFSREDEQIKRHGKTIQ